MGHHQAYVDPLPLDAGRTAPRRQVSMRVTLSSSGFGRAAAEASNLSRLGCRLEIQCRFPIGTVILVTFPGLAPVASRVIWSRSLSLGVSFLQPLGLPVVEQLTAGHPRRVRPDGPVPLAEWVAPLL